MVVQPTSTTSAPQPESRDLQDMVMTADVRETLAAVGVSTNIDILEAAGNMAPAVLADRASRLRDRSRRGSFMNLFQDRDDRRERALAARSSALRCEPASPRPIACSPAEDVAARPEEPARSHGQQRTPLGLAAC